MTASVSTHALKQETTSPARFNTRRWRAGVTSALTLAAVAGSTFLASSPASAATIEAKALSIAASKHGDPYSYGSAGPNRFDCSGLTYYSFKKAGKTLPRTAQAQYNKVHHISKASLRPGDLVFFHTGSSVYHVGIYAGGGKIWHAPHTGTYVKLEKIWTKSVYYGRV
ncbi:C40 family peptidase [Streptacidiphilus sp. PAMC 29251]|jgi:cell wall-associated NlpC family hydrolase